MSASKASKAPAKKTVKKRSNGGISAAEATKNVRENVQALRQATQVQTVTMPVTPEQASDFQNNGSMTLDDSQTEVLEDAGLLPPPPDPDAETERGLQLLKEGHADLSLVGGVSTDQLREALTVQTEQRALIKAFIQHHLVDGVDYGRMHVVRDCPDKYNCKKDYHFSKRTLWKPGQEKIFSLFSIRDRLEKDTEAYEMLGNTPGLVAYKCTLFRGEKEIGHGRGAAVLGDQKRDANSTIKIAEKRARMDACLSLGFSEYFAQDLDDADYKAAQERANEQAAAEAAARDKDDLGLWKREPNLAMDDNERKMLFATMKRIGYEDPDTMLKLLDANGVPDVKTMNSGIARSLIRKFRTGDYVPISVQLDPVVDVSDQPISADDIPDLPAEQKPAPISQEAELIVDDQFKRGVIEQFESLGLNARGIMWFKQRALGKPYGDWDKTNENDWRKIYAVLQDIMDTRLEVPEEYIAGLVQDPPHSDLDAVTQAFGDDVEVLDPAQPGGGH